MGCPEHPGVPVARPRLELADLVREHGHELEGLHPDEKRVLEAIASCRTASLGGHRCKCDVCGHSENAYNSCRNRHCPKCQGLEELEWVEARREEILPLGYFHGVFTVPEVLNEVFLAAPAKAYGLLFSAVSETLQEVAANPEHLGARIGFFAVLHTWTQQLQYHPHVHCILPGGGLSLDGSRFLTARHRFFLPVRVLSVVFRGKLLSKLQKAIETGKLEAGSRAPLWLARLRQAAETDWVVYCKPPFAGPEQVLAYLGRYTHRIAISNSRLVSLQDGQVTLRYKDRAHGNRTATLTLPARELLRRFLLHVLPKGFVRIRHFGLLANAVRAKNLLRCRELLGVSAPAKPAEDPSESWQERLERLTGVDVTLCPRCKRGHLRVVATLPPIPVSAAPALRPVPP